MLTLVRIPLVFNNSFSHLSSSSKDLNNSSTIWVFIPIQNQKLMIVLSLIPFQKPWVHHLCIKVEIFMKIWD